MKNIEGMKIENNISKQFKTASIDIVEREIGREEIKEIIYFSVSTTKLIVMSVVTLGLYEIYWFYKNWDAIRKIEHSEISPFWRGLFSFIFCYSLFGHISSSFLKQGNKKLFSSEILSSVYILLFFFERIVGNNMPYIVLLFIGSFTIVPLWKIQETINIYNANIDGKYKPENIFSDIEILFAIFGSFLIYIGLTM